MGALAGFRYRDIVKRLKALGLKFHRQAAGSHLVQPGAEPLHHHPQ
jgi:predicted RNA binding protein YcfA (HicA-like mRNA interferase family)